ncbi:hypothetical protein C8R47DRAFT_1044196 [Mycena vitilis]|nr:hypothetical protein C8R47DRAFT_1044196 [Mycena vitilis]
MATLEPILPVELEREIFELAALMHPRSIPAFLRVARRFHIWVIHPFPPLEPVLYRHPHVLPALLLAMKAKQADFFHHAVRHLYLSCYSLKEGDALLQVCTGVVDLTVIVCFADNTDYLPLLARMPLQRLCARIETLDELYPDFTQPAFASLTYLDVLDELVDAMIEVCDQIPLLPALTHVAIDRKVPWDRVQDVLARCAPPALCQPLDGTETGNVKVPCVLDVRFVMGIYDPETYATD